MELEKNRFLDLLYVYEKEIRKNTKNKRKVYLFEIYKMSYIKEIENIIESDKKYVCFYHILLSLTKIQSNVILPIRPFLKSSTTE